jgi:IS5 family transposase
VQLTFGDAEQQGRRKRTRREVFLSEMVQVVPWAALLKLIEPHYPKSGRPGRESYRLETMLRIHLLQQWYALSDPAMDEALCDTLVMRQFAQPGGAGRNSRRNHHPQLRRLLESKRLAATLMR